MRGPIECRFIVAHAVARAQFLVTLMPPEYICMPFWPKGQHSFCNYFEDIILASVCSQVFRDLSSELRIGMF